ncbi:hypothetical protein L9F63_005234 [Diploptera punctata]|uniref:Odorant receptor n=1 Tax=Diploptera punctata TaxID=6984 RepID=A0AAD7ZDT8_DIPPU|nr:hypothetical protein L9F63_005234 [Diploptera punctata]
MKVNDGIYVNYVEQRSVDSSENKNQTHEEQNKRVQRYLMDCIVFHQDLIRYATEVNNLLSPVMLVFFVFSEAMMCLSTFQFGKFDEKKFKFLWSVLLAAVWPLLVCLYGDDLVEQSIAVKQSVFNCRWYNRTVEFNKLMKMVMMRAQKPVSLKAGKFYVASLQTFADITHKVYAYFTLLKQMLDR